jgi:hypothetical protein
MILKEYLKTHNMRLFISEESKRALHPFSNVFCVKGEIHLQRTAPANKKPWEPTDMALGDVWTFIMPCFFDIVESYKKDAARDIQIVSILKFDLYHQIICEDHEDALDYAYSKRLWFNSLNLDTVAKIRELFAIYKEIKKNAEAFFTIQEIVDLDKLTHS